MKVDQAKLDFAARLNELADDMSLPPKGSGRQTALAKKYGVSQKGARKWLEGEGFPEVEKCIAIAQDAKVHFEWLMTGRGPKRLEEPAEAGFIEQLPDEVASEALGFLRYSIERRLQGEQLGRYLRWLDRVIQARKSGPPRL